MCAHIIVFEIASYVLTSIVFLHAIKKGKKAQLLLLALVIYGFGIEFISLPFTGAYHYSKFIIMLGPAPLCIGLFWMCIVYSAMELSDRLLVKPLARPFLDALLGLNIDLTMDAVAIRLGFWQWGITGQWFGVPYANFFGWFNFIFAFSAFSRLINWHLSNKKRDKLSGYSPLLALPPSLFCVLLSNSVLHLELPIIIQEVLLISLILVSLMIVIYFSKSMKFHKKIDWYIFATPFFFHIFFLVAILEQRFFNTAPALLLVSLSMLAIGYAVHFSSCLSTRLKGHVRLNDY